MAELQLQPGWAVYSDAEGRTFYANAETGQSTWEPPLAASSGAVDSMPGGWAAYQDDAGRTFYANVATGESSWVLPTDAAPSEQDLLVLNHMSNFIDGETHFLDVIENFCLEHCHRFGDECRESSADDVKEFPLEYHELHRMFVKTVEDVLERFVLSLGLSLEDFAAVVRRCGLKDGSNGLKLLRAIDSMIDFDIFLAMIQDAKRGGLR